MGEEVFIDANIFLEIFLDDSKADECENFLKYLEINKTPAFTSDFLIYACIIAIKNKFKDHKKMENSLIFFRSCLNLF
jgi:predicted nucleic acid-binding protein